MANSGQAYGTAVDGAGNVYVVDNANSEVIEFAAQTYTPTTIVSSGLSSPTALALDGAGNLYISDTGNNRVALVPNEQGTLNSADMTTVNISGLGTPAGLAVGGSGNLYVVDSANGDVLQVPTGDGTPNTVASGLTNPNGVAVDSAGNVYVSANNQVTEYPFGGGTPVPYGSGFSNPGSLAVDASGAVYVADSGNSRIVRVAPGGASQANLPATGISNPQGIALDSSFDVFFTVGGSVYEVNRTQTPAALTFPNTNVDSVSAAQTVTVSNAGNQTLGVSNVAASANFSVVAAGGTNCTSSTQLSSGLQCQVATEFAPTTSYGALTGTLTLTDNALNNPASTQTVQLSGGASQVAQTITFPTIPTQTYGGPSVTLNATASSGLTVSYSVISGPASVNGNTLTITGAGSVTVQANQAGNVEYAAATPVSQTFTVNPAAATVTFSNLTQTYTGSALSPTVTTNPANLSYSSTGFPDTNAGSYAVSATITDPNYTGSASGTFVINKASQTISWTTPPPPSATYGTSFTVVASASSGLAVSYSSSGGCTNGGTATYTMTSGTTACAVTVSQSGNSNYSAATSVSVTVNARLATPTVSFTGLPSTTPYNTAYTLVATTNASTTAVLTNNSPTVCSLTGTTVTIVGTSGNCSVTATWAADSNYNSATLTQTSTTTKGVAVITWPTPSAIAYGTPLSATQLDATASPASVYTTPVYSPAAGKILDAGSQKLKVTYAPHGDSNYATTTDTVTLQVNPASTTTTITSGNQSVTLNRMGTANDTVDFTVSTLYKPTGDVTVTATAPGLPTVTCAGAVNSSTGEGHCKLTFNQVGTWDLTAAYAGDSNHTGSTSAGMITVVVGQ